MCGLRYTDSDYPFGISKLFLEHDHGHGSSRYKDVNADWYNYTL
jgi:hypothetical protein